jgi:hypothetical protein
MVIKMFFSLAVWIFLPGCSVVESALSTLQLNQSQEYYLWDDFSDQETGWKIWEKGGSSVSYHNQGLRIQVNDSHFDYWTILGQRFGDVRIEVDAAKLGGPDDNDYGILCRYQGENNFYGFIASSDGYYGIVKMKNGQLALLEQSQLQFSEDIRRGQTTNHLRADCAGNNLVLFINGRKMAAVHDEDFQAGDVGLIAGSYQTPGVDILFDNFLVRKP